MSKELNHAWAKMILFFTAIGVAVGGFLLTMHLCVPTIAHEGKPYKASWIGENPHIAVGIASVTVGLLMFAAIFAILAAAVKMLDWEN